MTGRHFTRDELATRGLCQMMADLVVELDTAERIGELHEQYLARVKVARIE